MILHYFQPLEMSTEKFRNTKSFPYHKLLLHESCWLRVVLAYEWVMTV